MKIIGRVEAAERLGMTPQALSCHVSRRNWTAIPRPIKVGGRFRWIDEKITEFLEEKWEAGKPTQKTAKRGRPRKRRGTSCS